MDLHKDELSEFFNAILSLENLEECYEFFQDACTIKELESISMRYQVAILLKKEITYQEISRLTGASTATISRVNRALSYGPGGYNKIIDRNI